MAITADKTIRLRLVGNRPDPRPLHFATMSPRLRPRVLPDVDSSVRLP